MIQALFALTPQARRLYQSSMHAAGNAFLVYKAGSSALCEVRAPANLPDLLERLARDWAVPMDQPDHPVRAFLVELDRREPLILSAAKHRERNLKALCLAYAFLSGELRSDALFLRLREGLGPFLNDCITARMLHLRWTDDARTLLVEGDGRSAEVPVVRAVVRGPVTPTLGSPWPTLTESEAPVLDASANSGSASAWRLQDNAFGQIERLFVFWSAQVPYRCLLALLCAIPAHFRIVTTASSEALAALPDRLSADGVRPERYTLIGVPSLESRWARDYFLLGTDAQDNTVILHSTMPLLPANRLLAQDLGTRPELEGLRVEDVHVPFEGGDLRAIGPWLFVGTYTFRSALNKLEQELSDHGSVMLGDQPLRATDRDRLPERLTDALSGLSGREVLLIGDLDEGPPPLAHLDTYLTFLPQSSGRPVVVLADTRAALEILGDLSDAHVNEIERAILCASIDPKDLVLGSSHPIYAGTHMTHDLIEILLYGGFRHFVAAFAESDERAAIQARLDTTARWLVSHGFDVVLAPSILISHGYLSVWADKAGRAYLRTLEDGLKRTYNNALVEVFYDARGTLHRNVYLPEYGLLPLEARLREIYATLGYKTVFVPFMWEAGWGAGAVNCLTSEERAPFRVDSPSLLDADSQGP